MPFRLLFGKIQFHRCWGEWGIILATQQKIYQAATAHNDIEELFEDVFMVRGSVQLAPGILISRNMFILRQGQDLTIISSIRLSPEGEANLDALGEVKHVIRLGDFHGRDDPYYIDHYSAEFWRQPGAQTAASIG